MSIENYICLPEDELILDANISLLIFGAKILEIQGQRSKLRHSVEIWRRKAQLILMFLSFQNSLTHTLEFYGVKEILILTSKYLVIFPNLSQSLRK